MLKSFQEKYLKELEDNVIPFWEKYSIDHEYGGFFTQLDRDGSVYDTDKYMWLQWRAVYMFATLYATFKPKKEWLEHAIQGFDFLTKHGKATDNNYYFALNQKGEGIICQFNIYSEAFAMMGSAALYRATKELKYKEEAISAMKNYVERISNAKGKWEKSLKAKKQRLSLGHYMILANLGSVMKECVGINDFDERVKEAVEFVVNKFWNEELQVLFENINPDFTFDLESCDGRNINPGHGLESMWFILQYAEQHQRKDIITKACHIIKSLLKFGWDTTHGGIYYFMDVLNKPHFELQWDMKLWWVHNEAILACLNAYRMTRDKEFWDWFEKIDNYSFSKFKDNQHAEWFGYLNRRGEPTHYLKGGRWKGFFHLPRYLLFALEEFKKIEAEEVKEMKEDQS